MDLKELMDKTKEVCDEFADTLIQDNIEVLTEKSNVTIQKIQNELLDKLELKERDNDVFKFVDGLISSYLNNRIMKIQLDQIENKTIEKYNNAETQQEKESIEKDFKIFSKEAQTMANEMVKISNKN